MKRFLDVEKTRKFYHAQKAVNSTHRASLMVPELPGTKANISFLNHFLIKRQYLSVACRVTAIDEQGRRIESRVFPIDKPQVYVIPLTGMVDKPAGSYMVEFFSSDNLFIPFPAVMINHVGNGFHNSVHAYNRVLNDVFEDDEINMVHQREAAIDVRHDRTAETIAIFHAGPQDVDGEIDFELRTPEGMVRRRKVPLQLPKLCHRTFRLGEIFTDLPEVKSGVLKIAQPRQFLFYGRMLVGQMTRDGSLSANHSYYDCADFPEYWPNPTPSVRTYPYFPDFENILRIYPIMSPGRLKFQVDLYAADGSLLGSGDVGEINTPDGEPLECRIAELGGRINIKPETISSFRLTAHPVGTNTPTRVNHQLVYAAGGLESSINISLTNPNVFAPPGKSGFSWGQIAVGEDIRSWLGLTCMAASDQNIEVEMDYYSETGLLKQGRVTIPGNGSTVINIERELADLLPGENRENGAYVWYVAKSSRPDISAVVATRNLVTGHAVGEHSF
jgi:hypothetical protein